MEKVDSTAPAVWARHAPARTWCCVVAVSDSCARTYCRGAWNITDDVEVHDDPPTAERCAECVRCYAGIGGCDCRAGIIECSLHREPWFAFEMVDHDGGET